MKKLNLNNVNNLLSREQMRKVVGGLDGYAGNCTVTCSNGTQKEVSNCDRSTVEAACGSGKVDRCGGSAALCG